MSIQKPQRRMVLNSDENIINYLNSLINSSLNYLDFQGVDMDYSTHRYHDYPATMIPKLPELFINAVKNFKEIKTLYDPFMGSGTTLVEGLRNNLESTGVDLNPLAVLMSKVKTKKLSSKDLRTYLDNIYEGINREKKAISAGEIELEIPDFKNIDYWFKPYIIQDLQIIKDQILKIDNREIREFFLLPFSSTVRYVSNTRNGEFKMYRMTAKKLETWHPDVIEKFKEYAEKNVYLNSILKTPQVKANPIFGSSQSIPQIKDNTFDLLITSPPYGDSKTTVAYGQFSRTSLQWLDLKEYPADKVTKIDKTLLGGSLSDKQIKELPSETLNVIIKRLDSIDHKRALEVLQFYDDLFLVLKENIRVMKANSYQFWVTANRTVKGIVLPTDQIITEMYASLGVIKMAQYTRNIPNKRMPSKNSPSNKKGSVSNTMKQENITLYKTIK